jgi:hypothetical protein
MRPDTATLKCVRGRESSSGARLVVRALLDPASDGLDLLGVSGCAPACGILSDGSARPSISMTSVLVSGSPGRTTGP